MGIIYLHLKNAVLLSVDNSLLCISLLFNFLFIIFVNTKIKCKKLSFEFINLE